MPWKKIETSRGTFCSVTAFAKHFGFKYDNIKKLIREGRVEELFSGLFMGYNPLALDKEDRRIACSVIAKRIKVYADVEQYVLKRISTLRTATLQSSLITTKDEYVMASDRNAGKVKLFCGIDGHPEWTVTSERLLRLRTWCGHCQSSVKKTDSQVESELRLRGFQMISRYRNANLSMNVKCKNGHISTLTLSKIVNGNVGCPLCFGSREESIVRHYLEHFLGLRFDQVRTRPNWLYALCGRRLELDGFCSTHRIAFEYQGEHHFKQVDYAPHSLGDVIARDLLKVSACEEADVRLIVVPTLPKNWNSSIVAKHVLTALTTFGFSPVVSCDAIPSFVKNEPEKLEVLRLEVEKRGGILLATAYNGYHRPHLIQCGCSNEWGASPATIFRGCWCPSCGRERSLKAALRARRKAAVSPTVDCRP